MAYQWVFEGDHVLALPLGLEHVSEVLRTSTEHTAVSSERLPVHQKHNVTEPALLQQPGTKSFSLGLLM